jgi:hypothetical protein
MTRKVTHMNAQRVLTPAVAALMTVACGVVHGAPAAAKPTAPPSAAGRSTPEATGFPLTSTIDLTRPVHQTIDVDCARWAGPPNLSLAVPKTARAVAIVTIDARQAVRWGTVDGKRPTQAEAIAAAAQGLAQPMLWTGWSMHLSGPVLRGNVPATLTAYVQGGALVQDEIRIGSCLHSPLVAGGTYLAVFGDEVDGQTATGIHAPKLWDLMAYDPPSATVTAPGGAVRLPASLP